MGSVSRQNSTASNARCGCGGCKQSWFAEGWCCPGKSTDLDGPHPSRQGSPAHISLPEYAIGHLIGKGGETVKTIQDVTNCFIRVDKRSDLAGEANATRSVKISSRDSNRMQREVDIQQCVRTLQILCGGEEPVELSQALSMAMEERETKEQEEKLAEEEEQASKRRAQELEIVSCVLTKCGDMFSKADVEEALADENWDPNKAMDRLFDERNRAERTLNVVKPTMNVQKLLEASKAANAARKAKEAEHANAPSNVALKAEEPKPSKNVTIIRDVFAMALAKGAELQEKEENAKMSKTFQRHGSDALGTTSSDCAVKIKPARATTKSKKGAR